ncbi:MAG TPA: DMT family transporter [Patescibacteria group bacterium]|nr:DMT family transporter [Patescibacteria group bacterium]
MWLLYSLLAAVLWGVGQIFVKKGLNKTSELFNNVLAGLMGFTIFIPFALAHEVQFDKFWQLLPFTCIVSALFFSYYYAIGKGKLALTGTVIGTYPFVTVLLSFLFLGEKLSQFQFLAISLIIIGTIFVALPDRKQKIIIGTWLFLALLAVFMLGTADFLIKLLMTQSDIYTYLFTYAFGSLIVSVIFILLDKKGRKLPPLSRKNYLATFLGVGMIETGFFVFHLAANEGLISLVTPISGIYVAITAVLAWLILKEKIDKKHAFGITLAALGVILVGIA